MVALVFRSDFAMGAHAECAHFVVKGRSVEECLDLVELVRYVLGPGRGDLDSDADVYRQRLDLQTKFLNGLFHPCSSLASGCKKDPVGVYLFSAGKQDA